MGLLDFFRWGKKSKEVEKPQPIEHKVETKHVSYQYIKVPLVIANEEVSIPALQSSLPTADNVVGYDTGYGGIRPINTPFDRTLLHTLEELWLKDEDVSYAVHNIATLGNTEFTISFDETISEEVISRMQEVIRIDFSRMYPGGLYAIRKQLFEQLAIHGAMSYELQLRSDLEGLAGITFVNPKTIYFYYDSNLKKYIPIQQVTNTGGLVLSNQRDFKQGYNILNPYTYNYVPFSKLGDNPYGVPPMLPVVPYSFLDAHLNSQSSDLITKVGSNGQLLVTITPPARTEANDEQYAAKLTQAAVDNARQFSEAVKKGNVIIALKGMHELEYIAPTVNAEAAKIMAQLNQNRKTTALKQDAMMLSKDSGTTETLGRVLLTKQTASILSYQNLVDSACARIVQAHLAMVGFNVGYVYFTSSKPVIGDEVRDVQARAQHIENVANLYMMGIISQSVAAQELGYDTADEPEPRVEKITNATGGGNSVIPRDSQPARDQNRNSNPTGSRTTGSTTQRRS